MPDNPSDEFYNTMPETEREPAHGIFGYDAGQLLRMGRPLAIQTLVQAQQVTAPNADPESHRKNAEAAINTIFSPPTDTLPGQPGIINIIKRILSRKD